MAAVVHHVKSNRIILQIQKKVGVYHVSKAIAVFVHTDLFLVEQRSNAAKSFPATQKIVSSNASEKLRYCSVPLWQYSVKTPAKCLAISHAFEISFHFFWPRPTCNFGPFPSELGLAYAGMSPDGATNWWLDILRTTLTSATQHRRGTLTASVLGTLQI